MTKLQDFKGKVEKQNAEKVPAWVVSGPLQAAHRMALSRESNAYRSLLGNPQAVSGQRRLPRPAPPKGHAVPQGPVSDTGPASWVLESSGVGA